ncbi:sugar-binding protein [Candidatus Methylacidiphilum infernorum]|uniref:Uncharacterized conserved protein n=1 Tax=Methylacidiphilum infernorum (isolate V4) TaxID=481448 RepID=B3DZI7_METI4|nr:FlgD immunoglobulin-like domain containing protein [Candidatus Methylacidiphilum infernorum]ACD82604.1 Uncharacterized conserved protein [Methylacidiphilum infernorum V4]
MRILHCLLFFLHFVFASRLLFSQQTANTNLLALHCPRKVIIDGNLEEWNYSGAILSCYDLSTLKDTHSVQSMAMYDENYLYLAFRFKDKTPLENQVDPVFDPQGGWKGDAVQVRLKTPSQILHFTTWYYTPKSLPWISIHVGLWNPSTPPYEDIQDGKKLGVKIAFKKDPSGEAYTEEVAIPWSFLQKQKPYLHEKLRCGLEFFWGRKNGKDWPEHRFADLINPGNPKREFFWDNPEAWGKLELVDSLPAAQKNPPFFSQPPSPSLPFSTQGQYAIHYTLEEDQHISLVIEDGSGKRIRNLIADVPRKKGKNTDFWDGKDDQGNEVPPGTYSVRGLCHRPFHLSYQFAFGNPGNPQWLTPDGKGGWLSNHENPFALTVDDRFVYVAAATAEGACALMALDLEGKKQWGIGRINGGMLARLGPYLYMVEEGCLSSYGVPPGEVRLYRFNAQEGSPVLFSGNSPYKLIGRFNAQVPPPPRDRLEKAYEEGSLDASWAQREVMGFASSLHFLYCSLYYEDKILVVDEEGRFVREIPVKKPTGLAVNKKGELFILGDKKIYKEDNKQGLIPVVESGLSAPVGLALDEEGNLYVSEWGKAMQVKVFSREGKFLGSIGKEGGRNASGRYDPEKMFLPWGIGCDPFGRLWVAEWDDAPRRISIWNKEGKLVKEFCGSTYYGSEGCMIDPTNPNFGILMGNGIELDWKKGLWRVNSVLHRELKSNALFGPLARGVSGEQMSQRIMISHSKKWLISGTQNYACISELTPSYTAKPKAAMGTVRYFLFGNSRLPQLIEKNLFLEGSALEWAKKSFPSLFLGDGWSHTQIGNYYGRGQIWNLFQFESSQKGYQLNNSFLWIDRNGDGLVQEEEIVLFPESFEEPLFSGAWWMPIVDRDLGLYWLALNQKGDLSCWAFPCYGFNEVGSPLYFLNKRKKIFSCSIKRSGDPPQGWCDSKGNILVIADPLLFFSSEGKLLWQYPDPWPGVHGSHYAAQSSPGRLIGPLYVLGSAEGENGIGEIFCLAGNLGERYLFTTDGLFVGSLFKDCRSAPDVLPQVPYRGMLLDNTTAGGESFGGEFFKNPEDGGYYLIGSVGDGRECAIVAKVEGLESVKKMVLSPIRVGRGEDRSANDQSKGNQKPLSLNIYPLKEPAWGNPSSGLFDWGNPNSIASFSFDQDHHAQASWTFDKDYLYIGWKEVADDSPLLNKGLDPTKLFKTGDALIFEIRSGEEAGNTEEVVQGDIRLLFSVFHEKFIAVLYRYKEEGTKNPVGFSSPIGTTYVDQVIPINDVKIVVERHPRSYSLYASIPLKALNFYPKPGKTYRGDFGVIYSDKNGLNDILRMFWSNKETGMVSDLSIEASIKPSAWGKFYIETQ